MIVSNMNINFKIRIMNIVIFLFFLKIVLVVYKWLVLLCIGEIKIDKGVIIII